jgi:hypothetical protein
VAEWDDPIQRAAVWYVAVFGSAAVAIFTGANLTGFVWSKAAHPRAAAGILLLALVSCLVVVVLAARVLIPAVTLDGLMERQRQAEQVSNDKTWPKVADSDRMLNYLVKHNSFFDDSYAPITANAVAGDTDKPAADRAEARARCVELVQAANARRTRSAFVVLQWATPIAAAVVVGCAVAWGSVAKESVDNVASGTNPIPVLVRISPNVDPSFVVGRGCTARLLYGVAVSGDLDASPIVAIDAQGDCSATLLTVASWIGKVMRRP